MTLDRPVREADGPLRAFAGYGMKRAFNAVRADVETVLAPLGLRMVTYSALAVIGDNPGMRQGDLARALAIEKPNLVGIVGALEEAGLVARSPAEGDRRAVALSVTARGNTVLAKATGAVREHDRRMTAGLSGPERRALIAALRVIEENGRGR